ncbi:MAG: hypothetical protein ABI700_23670, partial [Chloroflexota bacterium]
HGSVSSSGITEEKRLGSGQKLYFENLIIAHMFDLSSILMFIEIASGCKQWLAKVRNVRYNKTIQI